MRRLLILATVLLAGFSNASGFFGVRASLDAWRPHVSVFAEQTLLELKPFEFVAGLRLTDTKWVPYSAVNAYLDNVFLQLSWSTKWIAFEITIRW